MSASATTSYPRVHEIVQSNEVVFWIAFGPQRQYIVSTNVQLHYSDQAMMRVDDAGELAPLLSASFGYGGVWVCVKDTGEAYWSGDLSTEIQSALNRKAVRVIFDSATSCALRG